MAIPPRSSPPSPRLVDGSCDSARRPSQRLTRALRRQTARIAQVPSQSVRSLALGVGQAAQFGDQTLRSLTNSLFCAFRARDIHRDPAC